MFSRERRQKRLTVKTTNKEEARPPERCGARDVGKKSISEGQQLIKKRR